MLPAATRQYMVFLVNPAIVFLDNPTIVFLVNPAIVFLANSTIVFLANPTIVFTIVVNPHNLHPLTGRNPAATIAFIAAFCFLVIIFCQF
jgi:hypothetical protein